MAELKTATDLETPYAAACRAAAESDPFTVHPAVIATYIERIDRAETGLASLQESYEAQHAKFDGCPHALAVGENALCGCSYDRPSDVCAMHAPALKKALEENAALQAQEEKP